MRHDLLTLELLLTIAQSRSITRGAEQLHVALAAASKRVADLEARLGVRLFLRKARGVEPTPVCQALLKHVQTVREGLIAFDLAAAEYSLGLRGHVRVAVARDVYVEGLLQAVARFGLKHPQVTVTLVDMRGSEVEEAVARGNADVGIHVRRPVHGSTLQAWPLVCGRWAAIVPKGHALQSLARVAVSDLLAFELIGTDRSNSPMDLMARAATDIGKAFEPRFDATSLDAVAALVEVGVGIAVVPDVVAARFARVYSICDIPLSDDRAGYELSIGVARERPMTIPVARLVKAIKGGVPAIQPENVLPPQEVSGLRKERRRGATERAIEEVGGLVAR